MALLFVGIFGIIQHTRTFATDMPEGVYTYDANFNVPAGYVKIVDDTTNPQYMVIMQKVPLTKQDGRQGFTYEEMKAYTPPKGYAIPTNALKDLLLTTNTSTTWVGSENFSDPGSRSDRTSDAIVDPGISNGQYYLLMSPRGYDGNYDPNGVTSNYFNATSSTKAKIRLIYVDHELNSGNITTKYGCNPGPQNLNTCAISNMDITSIAPDAFINMPNLQYLYFDNNKITSLDGIVRPASMIFLDLSRNRIAALEP